MVPMRVAYLCSMKRGLPVFLYREVDRLRTLGVDVHLYIMRGGSGVAMPEPDWPVVRIRPLLLVLRHVALFARSPNRYLSTLLKALRHRLLLHFAEAGYFLRDLEASSVDVLYCFEGKHALWIAELLRAWRRLPTVVIVHAEMVALQSRLGFTREAAQNCHKIITISEYNRARLKERFGIPDEKLEVVRLWSPYKRDDRVKVLLVGEWSERKGHSVLLDAMSTLDPAQYLLWVVGGGAWSEDVVDVPAEVEKRGMGEMVTLWGHVPERTLKVLYQQADIFALPSRTTREGVSEGIPVALMEAMSYGLPVVSTLHTGIPELVEEILVPEADPHALREVLVRLAESPSLRSELGRRNREIIETRFSERNVMSIRRALEGATRPAARA